MSETKRVLLGEVGSAHGIRGDVIVRSYTADPEDIAAYGALETGDGKPLPKLTVVRAIDRGVIVRFAGIGDRNGAERLKGTQLWIARDRLPAAADGEYYHFDLTGLDAFAPDGTAIGHVIGVENFGAGDLLEVRLVGSRQTEYFAFTNAVVPEVDIAGGRLVIVRPAYLDAPDSAFHDEDDDTPSDGGTGADDSAGRG